MQVKRITIRVPPELHQQLGRLAADRSVSLNTLAVEALEAYTEALAAGQERFPLRQLGALLAPAAEAADLTEEELLHHARQARRRIWQERYEEAVRSLSSQPETGQAYRAVERLPCLSHPQGEGLLGRTSHHRRESLRASVRLRPAGTSK